MSTTPCLGDQDLHPQQSTILESFEFGVHTCLILVRLRAPCSYPRQEEAHCLVVHLSKLHLHLGVVPLVYQNNNEVAHFQY
jgi:hypothetical protein